MPILNRAHVNSSLCQANNISIEHFFWSELTGQIISYILYNKLIKNNHRSRLNKNHLNALLKISTTKMNINIDAFLSQL